MLLIPYVQVDAFRYGMPQEQVFRLAGAIGRKVNRGGPDSEELEYGYFTASGQLEFFLLFVSEVLQGMTVGSGASLIVSGLEPVDLFSFDRSGLRTFLGDPLYRRNWNGEIYPSFGLATYFERGGEEGEMAEGLHACSRSYMAALIRAYDKGQ